MLETAQQTQGVACHVLSLILEDLPVWGVVAITPVNMKGGVA